MIRIPYQELHRTLLKVLLRFGFERDRAELCARLFTDTSLDGVYSHGVNRFPRFLETIRNGVVDIYAEPQLVTAHGAFERWDGRRGPGNLNAHGCMQRAIALSREHGVGCVALRNTNHWMRGGSYGWQAADAGVMGICWTNTMPNLPPWGASEPRLGNNPLVIAVPREEGHIINQRIRTFGSDVDRRVQRNYRWPLSQSRSNLSITHPKRRSHPNHRRAQSNSMGAQTI